MVVVEVFFDFLVDYVYDDVLCVGCLGLFVECVCE